MNLGINGTTELIVTIIMTAITILAIYFYKHDRSISIMISKVLMVLFIIAMTISILDWIFF